MPCRKPAKARLQKRVNDVRALAGYAGLPENGQLSITRVGPVEAP